MPHLITTNFPATFPVQSAPSVAPIERRDTLHRAVPADRPLRPDWKLHLYAGLPISVVLLAFVWMVTYGTWQLTVPESFGQFFDVQAESFLAGRWDVPPRGIAVEAYIHGGKFYGYFGFIPALARIGLNAAVPSMWGCWSRISLTLGCCVSLIYAYQLLLQMRLAVGLGPTVTAGSKWVYGGFLLAAGLGTTLIFLASRAYVYHEAIIWGSALALACYCHLMRYLRTPTATGLTITCALCFCSFFSRASVGIGTVAALLTLSVSLAAARGLGNDTGNSRWWSVPLRWLGRFGRAPVASKWHSLTAGGPVLAVVAIYVAVNQVKFGTWLDGMPLKLYGQVVFEPGQERMQRTRGQAVSWANFRTDVDAYFSLRNIQFTRLFPFVASKRDAYFYPESRYDIVEPHSSIPVSMPALSLLTVIGLYCAVVKPKQRRAVIGGQDTPVVSPIIVMIGAIAGAVPALFSAGISERYLHDFFPLLVAGGALGVNRVLAWQRPLLRQGMLAAVGGLVLYSVWVNASFALIYQRTIVWGVPADKQMEFLQWQDQVGHWINPDTRGG